MLTRLNKYLSDSGICSRRKADEHILAGDVEVNGKVVAVLGTKIDPKKDMIDFKGKQVKVPDAFVYYAVYKPKGVVSTANDELGRPTVTSLVPENPRVYPIGRLDEDSEGLMVLTNDGNLTQQLTHPSYKHEKEYMVTAKITNNDLRQNKNIKDYIEHELIKGIRIDGKFMKADAISSILINRDCVSFNIIIHTGYNRQVRKMCAKIGLVVTKLVRVRIANLSLQKLNILSGDFIPIVKSDIL